MDERWNEYRKMFLNRLTFSPQFQKFLQCEIVRDDDYNNHIFHKVMVHRWLKNPTELFDALAVNKHDGGLIVPVQFHADLDICHFYTESLSFVQKIINADFMFAHAGSAYNIDIIFADRTSTEIFGSHVTTEQIISGVVSRRFSNTLELNLSALCSDSELKEKQIELYSIGQLALYKRLMLRMGRDTKILYLSNNALRQVPQEIMNFFMRGNILGVNLSDNSLESFDALPRMSSLLERLWLEGNPLCEQEEPSAYVKKVSVIFPRLLELDGIPVNRYGVVCPLIRNYVPTADARALVDKFLALYFTHFDTSPRSDLSEFYAADAMFSISTKCCAVFNDLQKEKFAWRMFDRNLTVSQLAEQAHERLYTGTAIQATLKLLPETEHDPATFTVDVMSYTREQVMVTVDGVCRDKRRLSDAFCIRRTFRLSCTYPCYRITNDMLTVSPAPPILLQHAFNVPIRKLNELCLYEPNAENSHRIVALFQHLTGLRREEAERRLKLQDWDVRKALLLFADELRDDTLSSSLFQQSRPERRVDHYQID